MPTTTCLQTKVRNISGSTRSFGYLPTHGQRLEDGDEYVYDGGPFDHLDPVRHRRQLESFKYDLENGVIVIVETPRSHFYDPTRDETKILLIDNTTLSIQDPCWGAYSSSQE